MDIYGNGAQKVTFVHAAISSLNGKIEMATGDDAVGMEGHVIKDGERDYIIPSRRITVPSMTVKSLAKAYKIPKRFGLLSIDAEGSGAKVRKMHFQKPQYLELICGIVSTQRSK